jgi:hypothetical protein
MILKPMLDPVAEALKLAGLSPTEQEIQNNSGEVTSLADVRAILNENGASLKDAAKALKLALADEDQALQASKLTFQLHGALKDAERPTVPAIQINIQNNGENRTLLSLLAPT